MLTLEIMNWPHLFIVYYLLEEGFIVSSHRKYALSGVISGCALCYYDYVLEDSWYHNILDLLSVCDQIEHR